MAAPSGLNERSVLVGVILMEQTAERAVQRPPVLHQSPGHDPKACGISRKLTDVSRLTAMGWRAGRA